MEHTHKLVEQLDLAVEFLREESATKSRLALILTDNAVELLLHDRCEVHLREEADCFLPGGNRAVAKAAKEVLGTKFTPKVTFLERRGELSEDERLFCGFAHQLRNEAYHVGMLHESIAWPTALEYHRIACELFVRLRRNWGRLRGGGELSPVIQKHLRESAGFIPGSEETVRKIAQSLDALRPTLKRPFAFHLSESALARVSSLREGLEYFASNTPDIEDVDEAIRTIEFWIVALVDASFGCYSLLESPQQEEWQARLRFIQTEWKPRMSVQKLERWATRARGISQKSLAGRALQSYFDLLREMGPFEDGVGHALFELDEEINEQIKAMRFPF